jgi:hypothetical protein
MRNCWKRLVRKHVARLARAVLISRAARVDPSRQVFGRLEDIMKKFMGLLAVAALGSGLALVGCGGDDDDDTGGGTGGSAGQSATGGSGGETADTGGTTGEAGAGGEPAAEGGAGGEGG